MAVIEADTFQIGIGADTSDLNQKISKIVTTIESSFDKIAVQLKNIANTFQTLPQSLDLTVIKKEADKGEKALLSFESSAEQVENRIESMARRIGSGASFEDLSDEVSKVMKQVELFGGSISTLDVEMQKIDQPFNYDIAALREAQKSIEKLGLSIQDTNVMITTFADDVVVTVDDVSLLSSQINQLTKDELAALIKIMEDGSHVTEDFRNILNKNSRQVLENGKALKSTTNTIKQYTAEAVKQSKSVIDSSNDVTKQMEQQRNTVEILGESYDAFSITSNEAMQKIVDSTDGAVNASDRMTSAIKGTAVVMQSANMLTDVYSAGIVGATERLDTVVPLLEATGQSLRAMDSDVANLTGTLAVFSSVALKNLSIILKFVIFQVGNLVQAFGIGLFTTMRAMELNFLRFEKTLNQFAFGITNFSEALGSDMVGNLELWNAKMQEIVDTSTFGRKEIAKSIKLLVSEANFIGLNLSQMEELLARTVDVAAFHGRNLDEVMLALLSSLTGNTQAALALGIDLRELALAQTALYQETGKAFDAMTEQEKTAIRFEQIMKKTVPIIGAAAQEVETFTGKTKILEKQLNAISIKLGQMGKFTNAVLMSAIGLTEAFLYLPDVILELIGNFIDLGGVIFTATGTIIKYVVTLTTLITAFKIFKVVTIEAIAIQKQFQTSASLSAAFTRRLTEQRKGMLGLLDVFQNVAVFGMASIIQSWNAGIAATIKFTKFATSLNGVLLILKTTIGAMFLTAGKVFLFFAKQLKFLLVTVAPLVAKIGALITAVKAAGDSFDELYDQSEAVRNIVDNVTGFIEILSWQLGIAGEETADFSEKVTELANVLGGKFFSALVDSIKILSSGFLSSILFVSRGIDNLKLLFADTDEEVKELEGSIKDITKQQMELKAVIEESIVDILSLGVATAGAAEKNDKLKKSQEDVNKAVKANNILTKEQQKALEDQAKVLQELQRENLNLSDAISNIGASETQALKNNLDFALRDLQIKKDKLKTQNLLNAAIGKEIEENAKLLKSKQSAEILSNIEANNQQLILDKLNLEGKTVEAVALANKRALSLFDKKVEYLKTIKKLSDDELKKLGEQRKLLEDTGKLREKQAKEGKPEEKTAFEPPQMFNDQDIDLIEHAFGDAAGALAGSASAFMAPVTGMMAAAQTIVQAIQQLIDFLPNFIKSVANVFNSLTDLPKAIFDAVMNLEGAIDHFITNFVDNFAEFLPKIINALVKMIPRLMTAISLTLPIQLIGQFLSAKFWGDFIESFIKAIGDGLKQAVNDVANALGLGDVFKIDVDIEEELKNLGDEVARASDQLFKVVELEQVSRGLDVADRIRMALASGSSQGASFFERLFKKMGQFGTDLWNGFVGAVEDIGKWFGDRGTEIWNGFILPIATWFGDRGTEIWKGFILPIGNYFEEKGGAIWNGLKAKAGEFSAWAKEKGGQIWEGLKEEAGNITKAFKDFGGSIWDGLKTAAGNATEDLKGFGRKIWDGLRNAIQWPEISTPGWLQSFIDAVNNLTNWSLPFSSGGLVGKVQNSVPSAGSVGAKVSDKWKSIRGYSEGGPVASAIPQGLTKNGILYAQTGALSNAMGTDTIPAMLTPGEFVVNREATRNNLGLLSFINQNKDAVAPGAPQTSNFNITINAKTNLSADQIRREVVPELEKQLRRKSQEGRSVINAAGIRA